MLSGLRPFSKIIHGNHNVDGKKKCCYFKGHFFYVSNVSNGSEYLCLDILELVWHFLVLGFNSYFKYAIYLPFPVSLKSFHSNSMKDKCFRINRLTDLTFDSVSTFKSQLSYLLTSYSLASNLSLDSSREFSCHDEDLWYVYPKISLLCVPRGDFH